MQKLQFEVYTLPQWWASALINDDATGLSDEEHITLNEWLENVRPGHCVSCEGEPEFTEWHDARDYVLACDCVKFTFQKRG